MSQMCLKAIFDTLQLLYNEENDSRIVATFRWSVIQMLGVLENWYWELERSSDGFRDGLGKQWNKTGTSVESAVVHFEMTFEMN